MFRTNPLFSSSWMTKMTPFAAKMGQLTNQTQTKVNQAFTKFGVFAPTQNNSVLDVAPIAVEHTAWLNVHEEAQELKAGLLSSVRQRLSLEDPQRIDSLRQGMQKVQEILNSDRKESEKKQELRKIAENLHSFLPDSFVRRITAIFFIMDNVPSQTIGICLQRLLSDACEKNHATFSTNSGTNESYKTQVMNFREIRPSDFSLTPAERALYLGTNILPAGIIQNDQHLAKIKICYEPLITQNISENPNHVKEINTFIAMFVALADRAASRERLLPPSLEIKKNVDRLIRYGKIGKPFGEIPRSWKELEQNGRNTLVEREGQWASLLHIEEIVLKKRIEAGNNNEIVLFEHYLPEEDKPIIVAFTTDTNLTADTLNETLKELGYAAFTVDLVIVPEE